MKQNLQLRVGQQLLMTPQLQQAIKLLRLSSLDLHTEIQQTLYSNPMLELADEIEPELPAEASEQDAESLTASSEPEWSQEIPTELPVDAQWEDIYTNAPLPASPSQSASSPVTSGKTTDRDFEEFHSPEESLQDYLLWQLNLSPLSDRDRRIGEAIIDNINDKGWLETDIEALWQSIYGPQKSGDWASQGEEASLDLNVELEEVHAVLHRIQQFDPPGIAATDLRECLLIQLKQLPADTPISTLPESS